MRRDAFSGCLSRLLRATTASGTVTVKDASAVRTGSPCRWPIASCVIGVSTTKMPFTQLRWNSPVSAATSSPGGMKSRSRSVTVSAPAGGTVALNQSSSGTAGRPSISLWVSIAVRMARLVRSLVSL